MVNVNVIGLTAAGLGAVGLVVVSWRFAFFVAPYAWTGEPERLAQALGVAPGMHVADIGAGSGALTLRMADLVGGSGLVYATELSTDHGDAIERRARRANVSQVKVVAGAETRTRLAESCCDAIYMRAVFHHIADKMVFAADVASRLRPGGRLAVIDFPPGALWFHGRDHGVDAATATTAFQAAGLRLIARDDHWGGGMFLLVFARGPV